jgi:hypothetical protein
LPVARRSGAGGEEESVRTDAINRDVPIIERGPMRLEYGVTAQVYMMNGCRILASRDPTDNGYAWHLSISRRDRDPTWQEIATARYRILPDVQEMAMYLPPLDEYVNAHPYCFHLHEVPRTGLILP